jgi:hypothetical protein
VIALPIPPVAPVRRILLSQSSIGTNKYLGGFAAS